MAMTLFFMDFGAHTSLAQEIARKAAPSPATTATPAATPAKIEYTSPAVSFLYFKKLTEPLQPEARVKMVNEVLNIIKKKENKRVPELKIQGGLLSSEYYEISGDLSGRKLTVQHILPIEGKNAGNISFSWNEKNEENKVIETWFISLFLDGLVETALDAKRDKTMVSSSGKIAVGAEHQKFWQLQADQILMELHEELTLIGKLE